MYQKAFTLIEVLIVLIIIAILVTMAFMSYQAYVVRNQFIINAACRIEFKIREQGVDAAIRGKSVAFDVHSGKCYSTDIQQRYLPKDCQGQ